jgi:hypothetical protein
MKMAIALPVEDFSLAKWFLAVIISRVRLLGKTGSWEALTKPVVERLNSFKNRVVAEDLSEFLKEQWGSSFDKGVFEMKKLVCHALTFCSLAVVVGTGSVAQAAKYYYPQPVVVAPASPVYQAAVVYRAPAVYTPVVAYSAPVVAQPAPVVVQPAPVVVAAPNRVVNRGLFRTTKETISGLPGQERYTYHVHRLLGRNYHYTVQNNNGDVLVRERGW